MQLSFVKRTFFVLLILTLVAPYSNIALAEELPNGKLQSSEWVTSGVKLEKWDWKTATGKVKVNLLEIDLQNPYIKVDTIYGKSGETGNKQQIKSMAAESGAVAAINGDFFTLNAEGASFGATIQNGELINSPGYIHAKNAFMLDSNNIPSIERLNFDGLVTAENGASFQLFGINKTQYNAGYIYTGNSHQNRLHMYTDKWNMDNWVGNNLDQYTVVLVENGEATQKLDNSKVDIPAGGYLLLGHGEAAKFLQDNINIGDTVDIGYSLAPDNIITAVDGSTLLVNNGAKAKIEYEIKGNHARTAIGYSKDQRYLYLVTAEKSTSSVGMTLDELSSFLIKRGVWKAVNLDGGGSTTMVARPLGQFSLKDITVPQYGTEREVPNGLAVYSTAPKGTLAGWNLSFPKGALIGEELSVTVNSAYDQYYNPVAAKDIDIKWTYPNDGVEYNNGKLKFTKTGTYRITANSGNLTTSFDVKVYTKEEIKSIKANTDLIRMHVGEVYTPTVTMVFSDGYERKIANNSLNWSLVGVDGAIQDNSSLKANGVSSGLLIASYQGFSTAIPVDIGGTENYRIIDTFSNKGHYLVSGLNKTEKIDFTVQEENGVSTGRFVYDFGPSEGIRIAYLQYGTLGKQLTGEPAMLSLDVKGDNSNHWLRTEVKDANGKVHYIDLAKQIDWTGWKTVKAPLPNNLAYPITIKSIYVVHLENDKDNTRNNGELSFANFQASDWKQLTAKNTEKSTLKLTLNQKEAYKDQTKIMLDQAPVVIDGRTFLPIRHITELLGGSVNWLQDERKIEIINDNKVYELWLDKKYMSVNGQRRDLEVAPFVKNGRTMLPLRDISEAFGLYVNYDSKTKSITIK